MIWPAPGMFLTTKVEPGRYALHVFGNQAAIVVVAAARRGRDDIGDRLALEKIGLGERGRGQKCYSAHRPIRHNECLLDIK